MENVITVEKIRELMERRTSKIDEIIDSYIGKEEHIVSLLQDIQAQCNYLPRHVLMTISDRLNIPLSRIFSIVTFFRSFSLKRKGRHTVTVCTGTACHVRGSQRLLAKMKNEYKVKPGQTTDDFRFTLETVNCLGCCALGPVAVVEDKYEGKLNGDKLERVLRKLK